VFFQLVHRRNCFGSLGVRVLMFFHGDDELQELRYSGNNILDMLPALELSPQILDADFGHTLGGLPAGRQVSSVIL
jgi:hypothetical protein